MASGIGFGLIHNAHIGVGTILITIAVVAVAASTLAYDKSKFQGENQQ